MIHAVLFYSKSIVSEKRAADVASLFENCLNSSSRRDLNKASPPTDFLVFPKQSKLDPFPLSQQLSGGERKRERSSGARFKGRDVAC